VKRRSRVKNRKRKKNYYDLRIEKKYGITVNEVPQPLSSLISSSRNYVSSINAIGPSSPRNSSGNMASDWPITPSGRGKASAM
jgi:hypothetical protein